MIEDWQVGQLALVVGVGLIMAVAAAWYLVGFFRRGEPIVMDDEPDDEDS